MAIVRYTGRLGQTHFTLARQEAMIKGHGEQVVVFPVLLCPCLTDGQPDPNCPLCAGTSRYYPPNTAFATWMLLVSEHSYRTWLDPGTVLPGTIVASLLPGVQLANGDKLRRMDARVTFADEVLTRGYDDTLLMSAGVQVQLIADKQRVYVADQDYVLTPPNTITWRPGGNAPGNLETYSVRYQAQPEYLVDPDNPRTRLEHRVEQSQVVVLHLRHKLSAQEP